MFKFIFSFKIGNIYPANNAGDITTTSTASNISVDRSDVKQVNNEGTGKNSPLIQLVRQQRRQQLEETALIRKIAHQSFMSHYAVEHLPLSQVQEKLEEDNLPLIQLQQMLKQKNDDLTIYTTTKENLKSLFYNQRNSCGLLMRQRKFRPTVPTVVANSNDDDDNDNNNNNNNNNSNPTKDDRNYDVWDDAVIGRIMNLVDTIGKEPGESIQETEGTTINDNVTGNENSTFSENTSGNAEEKSDTKDLSKDEETIVAENVQEDGENKLTEVAEETIDYDETADVADDYHESIGKMNATVIQVTTLTTTFSVEAPDGLTRDSGYEDNLTSLSVESSNKRESGFFRKRRSIISPFFNKKDQNHSETYRNDEDLSRGSTDSRRSIASIISKISINDFDNRNKSSTQRPLPFLKKLWKTKRQQDKVNSCD